MRAGELGWLFQLDVRRDAWSWPHSRRRLCLQLLHSAAQVLHHLNGFVPLSLRLEQLYLQLQECMVALFDGVWQVGRTHAGGRQKQGEDEKPKVSWVTREGLVCFC